MTAIKRIVCENIRSAYNVGNIVRTADGLGRWVIISWYSAPLDHPKVQKTALWAQETIPHQHFLHPQETIDWLKSEWYTTIAAEKSEKSISLQELSTMHQESETWGKLAVIMWNELVWVMEETLQQVDEVVHIPMLGSKESLNVGQAAAIFMWELD